MAYEQKNYTESDAVKKWREQMEAASNQKPVAYTSQWQDQINQMTGNILNRKEFQYDVNADALYNQYKDRYVDLGQKAMMDTMGQAAKLTGGYGNSNAQIVGQQAYQNYLQALTDKIPELQQLAYNRYNQQGQDMYNQLGLLNSQEQMDYGRWNDQYNQWLAERDYLANLYNTERGYDYGVYRDTVADAQWQAQFDEDLRRFNFQNKLGEFAKSGSSGGGGGSSGGSRSGGSDGEISAVMYAGQKAKNDGLAAATQWVDGNLSGAEKVAAQANANGAARTEAIKNAQKKK